MKKTYLAYCRVSSKKQEEKENSLPTQKRIIEDYAERKGLTIKEDDWFVETKSGFSKDVTRKMFKQMLKRLKEDNVEGVIFHKVDRSSRNMQDFVKLESFFDSKKIIVIEGEFDTSKAHGRMQFRMFCSIAVWYSENLSEEVSTKLEQCLIRGDYPSTAPIGYKSAKGKGKKEPDRYFHNVRESFQLYATGEYSVFRLVRYMNKKGMRNKAGNKMCKNVMLRVLKNIFYYGYMKFGQFDKIYKGNHVPCVSKELFDRVQDRLAGKVRGEGLIHDYPYNRLIKYEGKCYLVGGKHRKNVYYEVHHHNKKKIYFRVDQDKRKSVREDVLDRKFQQLFASLTFKPEFYAEFRSSIEKAVKVESKNAVQSKAQVLDNLKVERGKAEARIKSTKKALLDGVFSEDEYREMYDELWKELEELKKQEAIVKENYNYEELKNDEQFFDTIKNFIELPKLIAEKYLYLPPQTKRNVLELFFKSLEIRAGLLKVELSDFIYEILDMRNFISLEHQEVALPKGFTSFNVKRLVSGGYAWT